MILKNYLQKFSTEELQVIGPFYDGNCILKEPIIYVDAGVQYRSGVQGISVGDGDSTVIPMDEKLIPKKSFSDLAFVLQNIPVHFSDIQLLGFLGHRKDHELMNLAEAHEFLKRSVKSVQICFDKKIKALSHGKWKLSISGNFSIFSFESVKLELSGQCEYQILPEQPFAGRSSQGLSNCGRGEIKIVCDQPLFIFLNPEE